MDISKIRISLILFYLILLSRILPLTRGTSPGALHQGHFTIWREGHDTPTILQHALYKGNMPSTWMAHRALVLLWVELPNDESVYDLKGVELTRTLCRSAFKDFDDEFVEAVIEKLLKPRPEAEDASGTLNMKSSSRR